MVDRIVGTIAAVLSGSAPQSYIEHALRPAVVLPTARAATQMIFLSECK
jgi:hypothetical protein